MRVDARELLLAGAVTPEQQPDSTWRYPAGWFDRILLDPSCSALGNQPCQHAIATNTCWRHATRATHTKRWDRESDTRS